MTLRDGEDQAGCYQLLEADGSWWVLGWDPSLGTFFAQHLQRAATDEGERILQDHGVLAREILTVEHLEEVVGRRIPKHVSRALSQDARAFPEPDPFARVPWDVRRDASPREARSPQDVQEAWRTAAARIAQRLADRTLGTMTSLPATPVAHTFEWLGDAAGLPRNPNEGSGPPDAVPGLATFLENLGLERSLIAGVLDGSIIELDADEISHVCERLHCSPFDLWGTELARAALNLYPPERWPRRIEPLDSGRNPPATLPEAKRLLRELVERQALTDLRTSEPYPAQVHEGLLVSGTTTVTGYRRAAILECHPDGHTRRVLGEDAPTSSDAEYHLAFMQVCSPTLVADLPDDDATARGAAGWDVPIQLAVAAQQLRNELADLSPDLHPAEIELVRFTPKAGPEVWLRWDTMTEAWELAHDPRQVYPGPPTDVLNPCGWNEPRPLQELDMPSGQAETPELSDPDLTP